MQKAERLVNLIALLLAARRHLSATEIRDKIYAEQSGEAFHRMFERDKAEIRELGLPLQQDQALDGEIGYRIARSEALLDDPGLGPDEMAALALAARAWGGGGEGALAVLKLSVGNGAAEPGPTGWLLPRVPVDRTAAALIDAVERRKVVRFAYRTGGGGEAEERIVEPHGLIHRGDWYLRGFDRARGQVRTFKLSRVAGTISVDAGPGPDFDAPPPLERALPRGPWEGDETPVVARVAVAGDAAWWVERRTGARRTGERADGWVELEMPCADVHTFAGWVAGFGDAAEALGPPELREAVVAHLRATFEPT